MDLTRLRELETTYRTGLLDDVVPFWLRHGWDRELGGVISNLDRDGSITDTDKMIWQQGRFAWTLGTLYNCVEPRDEWLQAALSALDFLERHGTDPTDGRMYFHVTRDGRPIRKRRYAFSESFACVAYAAAARATGRADYAERAIAALQRFWDHMTLPGRIPPKFEDTRPMINMGAPMIALVSAQVLRQDIGWDGADALIERSLARIRLFVKPELRVVLENAAPDGSVIDDHCDGRILNPGHAIEGAWFVMQEGKLRGDRSLIAEGCRMLDYMWERGWDPEYGGFCYFQDLKGLPVQEYWADLKFWWQHNEAIIATLMAWQLTREPRYARMHRLVHDWTHTHFPDPEYGEWFAYIHRDTRPALRMKGTMWKTLYHLPRMQLVCWQIVQELIAEALSAPTDTRA